MLKNPLLFELSRLIKFTSNNILINIHSNSFYLSLFGGSKALKSRTSFK